MKATMKIICKVCILLLFLYLTPFMNGVRDAIGDGQDFLDSLVYHQKTYDESISIKDQLNVLSYNSNFTIKEEDFEYETPKEQQQVADANSDPKEETPPVAETPKKEEPNVTQSTSGKKIYIYNTHQSEEYEGGQTVMDAGALLTSQLQERGYTVVLETNDFHAYGNANGLDYNDSYTISRKYINDAFVNYGGFDLVIDLHRDAVPHDAITYSEESTSYAKMMMVVGGLSVNADTVTANSSTLSDNINAQKNGIMRSMMIREAYYNQQMNPNMVLIELGANTSTFDEVKNSIPLLAEGIANYLG